MTTYDTLKVERHGPVESGEQPGRLSLPAGGPAPRRDEDGPGPKALTEKVFLASV